MARNIIMMDDEKNEYRLTLWLVVAIMTVFLAWASFTQINQQVHGSGRVIPAGKMRSIQHLEGGIITDIHVQEGETVDAGTTLFSITNKRAVSERNETEIDRDALRLRQQRLEAEMSGASTLILDEALTAKYPDFAATEIHLFNSRRQEFTEKMSGLQERHKQKILKLGEISTTLANVKKEADIAQQQLDIKTKLRNTGAISQSQFLDAQSTVSNFNTQIARGQAEYPITKAELAETQNLIDETRKTRQSEIAQELNDVNIEIKRQTERFSANTDQVDRTTITTPVKGIVNKIYINTIGGVVKPGEPVADIIPLDEKLIIEGRVSTKDRGKIWLGLPVIVKVSAYDFSNYGGVDGKLSYISADSFMDNKNNEYYQVRVTLDSTGLRGGKPILPGMTVDLNILADKISVLRALFKPIFDIKDNALTEK